MSGKRPNIMTIQAAARIQKAQAKANGGGVSKGSFASRAQSSAAKNSNSYPGKK